MRLAHLSLLLLLTVCAYADEQPQVDAIPLTVIQGKPLAHLPEPELLVDRENEMLEAVLEDNQEDLTTEAIRIPNPFKKLHKRTIPKLDVRAVDLFIKGLIEGNSLNITVNQYEECVGDVSGHVAVINEAFKEITSFNFLKVREGLKTLAQTLQVVPQILQRCGSDKNEIQAFIDMLDRLGNPKSFVFDSMKNILLNGVDVLHTFEATLSAAEHQEWRISGFNFGRLLATVFLQEPSELKHQKEPVLFASIKNRLRGSIKVKDPKNALLRSKPTFRTELMEELDKANKTWEHTVYPQFANLTLGQFQDWYLGSFTVEVPEGIIQDETVSENSDIPQCFDAREQWPDCIHPIRNQGHCGSCWAFGATEAASDRFCIASKGTINTVFSAQYMVSCDDNDLGCQGGMLPFAWQFMERYGLVTESCWPYKSIKGDEPDCSEFQQCEDGQPTTKYFIQEGSSRQYSNPQAIQLEVLANGPIETRFDVYEDFMTYKSGIYQHLKGNFLGGHAIKLIGWGEENGVKYWICANSWDTAWGENGFFRIKWNECGINNSAYAGQVDLDPQF